MTVVECPIRGTYLVRDETQPIPLGKTATDVSVRVHCYSFGWVCTVCQPAIGTTKPVCRHIDAVQERTCQNGHMDDDPVRGCWFCQLYL